MPAPAKTPPGTAGAAVPNAAPDRISDTWTLAGAKARFSEVVDRAQNGPQTITRNGKPCAVIVSADEWAHKTDRRGTLAEFLLASPLRVAELDLERQHDAPRDTTL
jgi:prevent-host-death family protein